MYTIVQRVNGGEVMGRTAEGFIVLVIGVSLLIVSSAISDIRSNLSSSSGMSLPETRRYIGYMDLLGVVLFIGGIVWMVLGFAFWVAKLSEKSNKHRYKTMPK